MSLSRPLMNHLGERQLTPDEERIVSFIEYGIKACEDGIERCAANGKYGSCADYQTKMLTLIALRDSLVNGLHDADHPVRVIEPEYEARRWLAGGL